MEKLSHTEIYFHVGLGKTATTYLQYKVFPKFEGLHYIQRTRYKKSKTIIAKGQAAKYFVSREFDQQFEREIKWFSVDFPHTTPIIVFRRHDSWIASQYRRFVKNGFRLTFEEFFDLENDKGYFKHEDLAFYSKIELLEQYFTKPPIVLFYDDLKQDPIAFSDKMAKMMGASFPKDQISTKKKHASYNEQQLRGIQFVGKYLNIRKRNIFENKFLNLFPRLALGAIRYSTLYISKLLPAKMFNSSPLIPEEALEKVKKQYEKDWKDCLEYRNSD